jgi:hypothetical protein
MKTLLRVIAGAVVLLALVLVTLRITGFNPNGPTPGLWLSGTLVTAPVTDWSFANSYPTIEVETSTWYLIPHSVTIWCVSHENHLYLQAVGKMWKRNVVRDPHVRIKVGNQLYDRTIVYVSDPAEFFGVEESMAKKYARWTPDKDFIPNTFLRVMDN